MSNEDGRWVCSLCLQRLSVVSPFLHKLRDGCWWHTAPFTPYDLECYYRGVNLGQRSVSYHPSSCSCDVCFRLLVKGIRSQEDV